MFIYDWKVSEYQIYIDMWDFLCPLYKHYITPHKNAELNWIENEEKVLRVQYHSKYQQTSAGFRSEVFLEPNCTYLLELEAKLVTGDLAFVYVESGRDRLVPRFKIYQNTQSYKLKHNFITPAGDQQISTYLGILFYHPDQDYLLDVYQLKLQKITPLTEANLVLHQAAHQPSILPDISEILSLYQPLLDQQKQSQQQQPTSSYPLIDLSEFSIPAPTRQAPRRNKSVETNDWDTSTSISRGGVNQIRKQQMEKSDLASLICDPRIPDIPPIDPTNSWLPSLVTRSNINSLIDQMKKEKIKIHISLTTVPKRLNKLDKVVNTLLKQSIPITTVFMVIPHRYKRFNRPYLVGKKWYFKADQRIKIVRNPDVGPMTKLHPILDQVGSRDIIITVDDDHFYPRHWAYYLCYLPIMYPKYRGVYGLKGNLNQKTELSQKSSTPLNVDWLSGDLGVAYPVKWIRNPSQMLKQVGFSPEAFFSDDLLIANHLARYHISRIVIPQINYELINQVYPKKTPWANSRDSLHRMNPSIDLRYQMVINVLREKKQHFLDYRGYPMKLAVNLTDQSDESSLSYTTTNTNTNNTTNNTNNNANNNTNNTNANDNTNATNTTNNTTDHTTIENQVMNMNNDGPARMIRTRHHKLDPSIFDGKKVRYISYQNQIYHTDWVLLYIRKLSNASLEMPNLDLNISLPNEYAAWFDRNPNEYDVILIDIPFCLETNIKVKTDKPIYYLYRYPEIGNPKCILQTPKQQLIINANYHSNQLSKSTHIWRVLPELSIKNVGANWSKDVKHLALIITDGYYVQNIDSLLDFWRNHCGDEEEELKLKLHIGVTPPLSSRLQKLINQFGLKNINIYTTCNMFGALIYRCDYYFSFGYNLDPYAVWAHQNQKQLIVPKYTEFKDYPNVIGIPFSLGQQKICPELLHDHNSCQSNCLIYGTNYVENVPVIKQMELKYLLINMFKDSK